MTATSQALAPHAPIRCLVIQLARLGDTIQSLMALRAAKQLYPQLEIHFLARERFASAARRTPWIKSVITLPTESLLAPIFEGTKSETEALGDIARWLSPLVKEPWDMIVNWTFSESSSYLAGLIPSRIRLGYTRRRDTSFAGADGWSHYMQAIIQGRVNQNIHLTDILTTQLLTALQIHAGEPLPEGNGTITSKYFFSLSLNRKIVLELPRDKTKKWIAVQLGAGESSKAWAPEKWFDVVQYILTEYSEYGVFLLGGREDSSRARLFQDRLSQSGIDKSSVVSLVGETDFDLWTTVISKSQWLLAADTAAIHLASVLGTRVLNVSIGPVKFEETGPYGNGHYVITPNSNCTACLSGTPNYKHTCGEEITPEAVFATWSYATSEWAHQREHTLEQHFESLSWENALAAVRIFRSRIRSTTDGGGVLFEPAIRKSFTVADWTSMVIGQVARSWYCGWTPPVGHELTRNMIDSALIKKLRELEASTEVLMKICKQASQIALQLREKGQNLKSNKVMGIRDREEIQNLGKGLGELDTLIDRLAKTHPPLLAFSQMGKVLMHHLEGEHISELGKETAECYNQLSEGVAIFREWIKFTLDLARPVNIKVQTLSRI